MNGRAHPRKVRSQIYSKLRTVTSGSSSDGSVRIEPFSDENPLSVERKKAQDVVSTSTVQEEDTKDSPKPKHMSKKSIDHGIVCSFYTPPLTCYSVRKVHSSFFHPLWRVAIMIIPSQALQVKAMVNPPLS